MSSVITKGFSVVTDEQYSTEIESLLQKTEFESKRLLKSIEDEKEQIVTIKKQLELRPKQIKEVETETRRCEEEVKALHRQLTQNMANVSMKKQGIQLDEEIERLQNKLEGLVKQTSERAVEYNEKLENYKAIWKSYEQKYTSTPKAQEVQELQQTVDMLTAKKCELVQKREALEKKLNDLTMSNNSSRKPSWTDWFVKLASVKIETMKLQNDSTEIHQAKLKALEENKFLKQKLASLKAKQHAEQLSLQVDNVIHEAPQEQYEDEASNEPIVGDMAEMVTDDATLLVNPMSQDQQLPTERTSAESTQMVQQMTQFTFTDTNTTSDTTATTFGISAGGSQPTLSQQMAQFTFTDTTNATSDSTPATFNIAAGNSEPTLSQQMAQFTFTDTTNSPSDTTPATFSIAAGSSEPTVSQGGFNFTGFGGEDVNMAQQAGLQLPSESNTSTFFGQFSFTSPCAGGSREEGATGVSCFGSPASTTSGGHQDNFFLFPGTQTPAGDNSSNVFSLF